MTEFRRLVKGALNEEVLVPLLRAYFSKPTAKTFLLPVEGFDVRESDGWFHPSTHPVWPSRMLYYYLTEPDKMVAEPPDPVFVLAVTQGKFWHVLVQHILDELGVLRRNPNPVDKYNKTEFGFEMPSILSRGLVDGITVPEKLPIPAPEIFEFKTMNPMKLSTMPVAPPYDEDVVEWFKEKCWEYYCQAIVYMMMSGIHRWRGLIMAVQSPFPMREVVLELDHGVAHAIKTNYITAIDAAKEGKPPMNCCSPRSKESKACPARAVCPVALA
jgi:hypothetical protein